MPKRTEEQAGVSPPKSIVGTDDRVTAREERAGLPIISFDAEGLFDAWLGAEPRTSKGLWLKLSKKGSGIASISRAGAVDAALCHGWIDGHQVKYDDASWLVRCTPRKRGSRWSQLNRTRALELTAAGRMRPAGLAEIEAARSDGRWDSAYAPASTAQPTEEFRVALDASTKAAAAFARLKGAHRYAILYRIAAVKRTETRLKRITGFIEMLERGQTVFG